MSYQVDVMPKARKALAHLPRQVLGRVLAAIEALADDPRPPGSVKLKGSDGWRIRVGDYRVIYQIHDARLLVLVIDAGHRKDIYRRGG